MKKLKIYLDTSVISHLLAEDTPEKMADTQALWLQIQCGKYDVVISEVTLQEIRDCKEPKRSALEEKLGEISFSVVTIDDEVKQLAGQIIQMGILKEKNLDDCLHIAAALLSSCQYIISWNFKHMVNVKTINGVRAITSLSGYCPIDLIAPTLLIQGDD